MISVPVFAVAREPCTHLKSVARALALSTATHHTTGESRSQSQSHSRPVRTRTRSALALAHADPAPAPAARALALALAHARALALTRAAPARPAAHARAPALAVAVAGRARSRSRSRSRPTLLVITGQVDIQLAPGTNPREVECPGPGKRTPPQTRTQQRTLQSRRTQVMLALSHCLWVGEGSGAIVGRVRTSPSSRKARHDHELDWLKFRKL